LAHRGESADVLDLVEDHQREYFSYPGNRAKKLECKWVVMAGLAQDLPFEFEQDIVIDIQHRDVGLDGTVDQWVEEALGDVGAVPAVLDALGESGEVVLSVGVLDVLC